MKITKENATIRTGNVLSKDTVKQAVKDFVSLSPDLHVVLQSLLDDNDYVELSHVVRKLNKDNIRESFDKIKTLKDKPDISDFAKEEILAIFPNMQTLLNEGGDPRLINPIVERLVSTEDWVRQHAKERDPEYNKYLIKVLHDDKEVARLVSVTNSHNAETGKPETEIKITGTDPETVATLSMKIAMDFGGTLNLKKNKESVVFPHIELSEKEKENENSNIFHELYNTEFRGLDNSYKILENLNKTIDVKSPDPEPVKSSKGPAPTL